MNYEDIVYEVEDRVATITLYRPDKLNAQTATMTQEIHLALDEAEADDNVRAVVFTGAGRAFCAGSDMSAGPAPDRPAGAAPPSSDRSGSISIHLFDFPKPVIGAINGAAVGFGASSTLAMDIRIGSPAARFGFVYARRGIPPESAASWFLPRIVGPERALRWMYSGEVFGAQDALDAGLLSEIVEPDALLERAYEIAKILTTQTSAVSIALIRQLVWKGLSTAHPLDIQQLESELTRGTRGTPDAKEGILSFLEQRAPDFVGKVSSDLPAPYPWWK